MSAIIYCYTNKINNKKYVGQTNNEGRRIREHKSNAFNENSVNYQSIFHKAIRKYGWDNFTYEVLESFDNDTSQEEIDERERFWIKEKDSLINKGYNILNGGQGKWWQSKFSPEEIKEIKQEIKSGLSYDKIVSKWGISKAFISSINHGYYFFDPEEKYPLKSYLLEDEKISSLVELLEEAELTFKEIASLLSISEATVKKINYGTLRKGLSEDYPIRKITPQKKKALVVIDLLVNTSYSNRQIQDIANVSAETVRRINRGETNRDSQLNYPLRKSL